MRLYGLLGGQAHKREGVCTFVGGFDSNSTILCIV